MSYEKRMKKLEKRIDDLEKRGLVGRPPTKKAACEAWLLDFLLDGSKPAEMVLKLGQREGYTHQMLYKLKSEKGIESTMVDGAWHWEVA